ncbi:MAG: YraN family protein [Lachnospiraceae bacterium]|nr:YraN family protein [Lachnospiraceae bacterium]
MNKRETGTEYEEIAAKFLSKNGVKIIERNFRCRIGEIDLIGYDGKYLVFFEVKYRAGTGKGYPLEAVTKGKRNTIKRVSDYYRMIHHVSEFDPVRFDVVSILGDDINWIKNAFDYYC